MKIKLYIYIFLLLSSLFSCYEDKGNYDYKELNEVQIEDIGFFYSFYIGDTLDIKPKLTFALDEDADFSYEWVVNGEVISTDRNLYIENYQGSVGFKNCYYSVTENSTGVQYIYQFRMTISGVFQTGWLILSEKDGKSCLSLIRPREITNKDGEVIETRYEELVDAYQEINKEELGSMPIKLVEHWNTSMSSIGEILVIQQGGQGCVELEGSSLIKAVNTKQEFLNEKLPEGFVPADAMYGMSHSYLLSTDNKLYSRKNYELKDYHSGSYSNIPIYFNGGLKITNLISVNYFNCSCGIIFDNLNKRFLCLGDDEYYPDRGGKIHDIKFFDYPENFSDLNNLNKTIIKSGYTGGGSYWDATNICSILQDPTTKEYYVQEFKISYSFYYGITVEPKYEEKFVGSSILNGKNQIAILPHRSYIMISGGSNNDKLYYYDKDTKKAPIICKDFNGVAITTIDFDKTNNYIAVGLENGDFYILNTSDETLAEGEAEIIYKSKNKYNKIVDVLFKFGEQRNFRYQD